MTHEEVPMPRDDQRRDSSLEQRPVPGGTPEEQMADDVLDRPAGEGYNPNPQDVVEQNRARFDAFNNELNEAREEVSEFLAAQDSWMKEEEREAAANPAHQEMLSHQRHDQEESPLADTAGKHKTGLRDRAETVDKAGLTPDHSPTNASETDRARKPFAS